MGVRSEARFLRDQGMTLEQVATNLGVSRQYVHKILHSPGPDRPRAARRPTGGPPIGPRGLPKTFFARGSDIVGLAAEGRKRGNIEAHWKVRCGGCGRCYTTTASSLLDLRDRCARCAEPGREPAPAVRPPRGRPRGSNKKKQQIG